MHLLAWKENRPANGFSSILLQFCALPPAITNLDVHVSMKQQQTHGGGRGGSSQSNN
jgi:hypothetical protein